MTSRKRAEFAIGPEKLRWRCDPASLPFSTTDELTPLDGVVGQPRAMEALELGLTIRTSGFHVFATGTGGTGKMSTIKRVLAKMNGNGTKRPPRDIVFLFNFNNPNEPYGVKLTAGEGHTLRRDMHQFVADLQEAVPNLFDNKEFKARRDALVETFRDRQKHIFSELEAEMKGKAFAMVQVQIGNLTRPAIMPIIEDQPVPFEQLEQMAKNGNFPSGRLGDLKRAHQELSNQLESTLKEARRIDRELKENLRQLEKDLASTVVKSLVNDLREDHAADALKPYFDDMYEYTLENLSRFKEKDEAETSIPMPIAGLFGHEAPDTHPFLEWDVNVVVDNAQTKERPIIVENTPTYRNLFGTIERALAPNAHFTTDFTKIRAGSILRADGGYVIFHLMDALTEPGVWKALKRTIKSRKLEIESYDSFLFYLSSAMKPLGIDIDVKFVVVGENQLYHFLYAADEDFRRMFKIRADFDTVMGRDEDATLKTARFVAQIVRNDGLPPFDRSAIAALLEEGVAMAGDQEKLTTRFSVLSDLVCESAYWANKSKAKTVLARHVDRALDARRNRANLVEERIQEMIRRDRILIDTAGGIVGRINGLSVYQIGDYLFGKPTRITCSVAMGRAGVINIEREAKLSGKLYDKGLFILSGFLRSRFSQDKPISLSASIAFEQSYGLIDGDSASMAETIALFSAIAGVAIDQSVAVTGSLNQDGEVQPIGAVNEKIDGFYSVCKERKLTGKQGVIIPAGNERDLMLRNEITEAVKKGKFHVWSVSTIDEALEICTGIAAGKRGDDGHYPPKSLNGRVDKRLLDLARDIQDFGKEKKKSDEKGASVKPPDEKTPPKKSPARKPPAQKTPAKK
ncbi:AAA family ATPase [bacterium]|nr:AAA family ATPase [bacterium]